MKKLMKNNKAITLIALVITIVILLILTAVAVSLMSKNNVVDRASSAKKDTIIGKEKEDITIAITSLRIKDITDGNYRTELNQDSGYKIETENGDEGISVYANILANELNANANTLNSTLKTADCKKVASTDKIKIADNSGTYQENKNGILVWDFDRFNNAEYIIAADWVKVKFENTSFNNVYVVNKWTGEIIEGKDTFKAQFPIRDPGSYEFTVNAGYKSKWLYMKKFNEVIPSGASINYSIFVSDDKETWDSYASIPEIDKYTQYIKVCVELIPNSKGECPSLDGLVVKFKHMGDDPTETEEVVMAESSNIKVTANGYTALNEEQTATITQKIGLSTPMTPEQIISDLDVPIFSTENKVSSGNGGNNNNNENSINNEYNGVTNTVYVSKDNSTWIPIENATPGETYSYVKVRTVVESHHPEITVGLVSINPSEENNMEGAIDLWKTVDTRYYYAISDIPVEWIRQEAEETIPEDTRILYSYSKSDDADHWTGYSKEITANNNSEFIKVKVDFQVKNAKSEARPQLKSLEIICNYNGTETTQKTNGSAQITLTVASQNENYGTVSNSTGVYRYKESVTVVATPKTGYRLVGWSDGNDIVSTSQSYTFSMPNYDYTLNAIWMSTAASLGEVLVYDEHTTFVVVTDKKTWSTAQSFAESYGGRLAVIDNQEKQNLIYSRVKSVGDVWIGVTDAAQEGVWLYTDGRPASIYSNWNSGEPNNSGNEDYAEMYMASGKWNDLNGTQSYPFIMEFNY